MRESGASEPQTRRADRRGALEGSGASALWHLEDKLGRKDEGGGEVELDEREGKGGGGVEPRHVEREAEGRDDDEPDDELVEAA